jgi:excinuclease ABC subunit A
LDEPTTGLHFADIEKLLHVLERLVEAGNTVLVVEHNLEVIAAADWVIDMGPEAGDGGGRIVCEGPPEDLVIHAGQTPEPHLRSHTGEALRTFFGASDTSRPSRPKTARSSTSSTPSTA